MQNRMRRNRPTSFKRISASILAVCNAQDHQSSRQRPLPFLHQYQEYLAHNKTL